MTFKEHVFNFSDTVFFSVPLIWHLKLLGKNGSTPKSIQYSLQTTKRRQSNSDSYENNHPQALSWIWFTLGEIKHTEQESTNLAHELLNLGLGAESPGANSVGLA